MAIDTTTWLLILAGAGFVVYSMKSKATTITDGLTKIDAPPIQNESQGIKVLPSKPPEYVGNTKPVSYDDSPTFTIQPRPIPPAIPQPKFPWGFIQPISIGFGGGRGGFPF